MSDDYDTKNDENDALKARRLNVDSSVEGGTQTKMDYGCGCHAYCEYCSDYCRMTEMESYLYSHFSVLGRGGYSPNAMKEAVVSIVSTCSHFGFLTNITTGN